MKKITDVFVFSQEKKSLFLAEIEFDSKIHKIKPIKEYSATPKKLISSMKKLKGSRTSFLSGSPEVFDGNYNLLIPAGIDPHVHFDDPGFEFRENFYTGTLSAVFGGITTIIDMPCTSVPPVINKENLQRKLEVVSPKAVIDFAFWGGVSGTEFDDNLEVEKFMSDLAESGVVGYKTYLISGMKEFTELNEERLEKVANIAKKLNLPVAVHAEDKDLVRNRRHKLQKKNKNEFSDYCRARDVKAEVTAVKKVINIARRSGAQFHIVHLSSKKSMELVRKAHMGGVKINTETCPHFLAFTQSDYKEIGSILKTAPPVKKEEDKKVTAEEEETAPEEEVKERESEDSEEEEEFKFTEEMYNTLLESIAEIKGMITKGDEEEEMKKEEMSVQQKLSKEAQFLADYPRH